MDKITRDQIERDFEQSGIRGGSPEETGQMLDRFSAMLQAAYRNIGVDQRVETPARERTEETMCAMKEEIRQLLDRLRAEEPKEERLSNVTISLMESISGKEWLEDEFFPLIELLLHRPDMPILAGKYGLSLELKD